MIDQTLKSAEINVEIVFNEIITQVALTMTNSKDSIAIVTHLAFTMTQS